MSGLGRIFPFILHYAGEKWRPCFSEGSKSSADGNAKKVVKMQMDELGEL